MSLKIDIIHIFLKLSIISTFLTIYMVHLYICDNRKFQETVINITYFLIDKYSHLQISSRKAQKMYISYIEEPISSIIEKIKDTEIYNQCLFLLDFFTFKEKFDQDYEYKNQNSINYNEVIEEEVTIDFIKDNHVVYTCSKEEFINLETEYDFMICERFKNNVSFQKIFHKVHLEEDFEFRNLDYNVLSLIIIPINENEDPLNIQLVGNDYYFWIENNIINKCFLDYFLETYYSTCFNDYQVQIITNDINIYNVKMYENEAFQILENGIEVFDFSYFDMPDLIENTELSDLEGDYDIPSLEEKEDDYDIPSLEENSVEEQYEVGEEQFIKEEEIVEEEIVEEEIVKKEIVGEEIVKEEIVKEEIVGEEIVEEEIVEEEIIKEEIVKEEIVEEEIVEEEIVEEEIIKE